MKRLILSALILTVPFAPALLAQSASPTPAPDPLVGNWRWGVAHWTPFVVEVRADGTAKDANGKHAEWTFQPSTNQERHYTFVWEHGRTVDAIVLSTDGKTINGKTSGQRPIKAERVVLPSADPNRFGTK